MKIKLNDPTRLANELQIKVARIAEKHARLADLGFQLNEKTWCELTFGSILIQSLQALELLSEDEQNNIINMYNLLMNK